MDTVRAANGHGRQGREVRDHHTGPDLLQMMRAYVEGQPSADLGPRARVVSREYRVAHLAEAFGPRAAWRTE